nr:hypothetical protein [Pseudomonas chengduensis]
MVGEASSTAHECRLCRESKPLERSHIIPKSFYRRVKGGESQLYAVTAGPTPLARQSNGDQIQYLLCRDCESFISRQYENYGTQLFTRTSQIIENDDYIYILKFRHTEYYLFIITILWRAAVSDLQIYREIKPLENAESIFRQCIRNKTLSIDSAGKLRIDDFIKITIFRLTDPTNEIPQEALNKIMYSLSLERGKTAEDGVHYFFTVDGYLITASVFPTSSPVLKQWYPVGRLRNRSYLKIPKVSYHELEQIRNGIDAIANARDVNGKQPSA